MYIDDDNASKLTSSSGADDDNFAMALVTLAKSAKQAKHGSALAGKEVIASHKRKSIVASVPCKKKKDDTKIIGSDSDDDNEDDNFLVSCGKAMQRDPLKI
jgi:hypothetical protein